MKVLIVINRVGSYYFQCEHDMDRTILNEMEKQYKAIDVHLIDEAHESVDVHRVKDKVFLKSAVRIQATLERDGYREFQAHMLIDANGTNGPFAVYHYFLIDSGLQNVTTLERIL
jgi:hypothetical protein